MPNLGLDLGLTSGSQLKQQQAHVMRTHAPRIPDGRSVTHDESTPKVSPAPRAVLRGGAPGTPMSRALCNTSGTG